MINALLQCQNAETLFEVHLLLLTPHDFTAKKKRQNYICIDNNRM